MGRIVPGQDGRELCAAEHTESGAGFFSPFAAVTRLFAANALSDDDDDATAW